MSAVSSRPRVRSVTSTATQAAALGAVTVGALAVAAIRALAREALPSLPPVVEPAVPVDRIVAGPEVAARLARLRVKASQQVATQGGDAVAIAKARTLLALAQAPIFVRPSVVESHIECLLAARDVRTAHHAEAALLRVVQTDHSRVLGDALTAACREASIRAGFPTVQMSVGTGGMLRVVATDQTGRALVTEIDPGNETRTPIIETEVVGVTDGSCHDALNRFDRALEERGVVADGSAERKWTGGVCELSLAREFVRQQIRPASGSATEGSAARRRPQRRAATKLLRSSR